MTRFCLQYLTRTRCWKTYLLGPACGFWSRQTESESAVLSRQSDLRFGFFRWPKIVFVNLWHRLSPIRIIGAFVTNLSSFEILKNKGKLHSAVGRQVQCRRNISWKVNTRLVFSRRKRCTQEKCLNNMQRTIFPILCEAFQHIVVSFLFLIGPMSRQV